MGQERHLIRCREVQKSRYPSGWGRRDFQSRGNSGDEGPQMGVHMKSLVKSKGAGKAEAMIKVRQAVESIRQGLGAMETTLTFILNELGESLEIFQHSSGRI